LGRELGIIYARTRSTIRPPCPRVPRTGTTHRAARRPRAVLLISTPGPNPPLALCGHPRYRLPTPNHFPKRGDFPETARPHVTRMEPYHILRMHSANHPGILHVEIGLPRRHQILGELVGIQLKNTHNSKTTTGYLRGRGGESNLTKRSEWGAGQRRRARSSAFHRSRAGVPSRARAIIPHVAPKRSETRRVVRGFWECEPALSLHPPDSSRERKQTLPLRASTPVGTGLHNALVAEFPFGGVANLSCGLLPEQHGVFRLPDHR